MVTIATMPVSATRSDSERRKRRRRLKHQFVKLVIVTVGDSLIPDLLRLARVDRRAFPTLQRQTIHAGGWKASHTYARRQLAIADSAFRETYRIDKQIFWRLLDWLETNGGLRGSRYQSSAQKLLVFLWIIAFGEPQRNAAHRFLCAQSTVHAVFHAVLAAMLQLFRSFVRQPSDEYLSPHIELNADYNDFNGCIGAIDGTLVAAHVPSSLQNRWRSRKGWVAQNVFAAVRFNLTFSYVLAGGEGSMHDNNLLGNALAGSFNIPRDRFYLADAGFGPRRGTLMPFNNTRYHLQEWETGQRRPQTPKELYNRRHSRHRIVVERIFGVVKRRWKILRSAPPEYGLRTQIRLVYAICGLHNFTQLDGVEPDDLDNRLLTPAEMATLEMARQRAHGTIGEKEPHQLRQQIADAMWPQYEAEHPGVGDSGDS